MKTGRVLQTEPALEPNRLGIAVALGREDVKVTWHWVRMPGGEYYQVLETDEGEVFAAREEVGVFDEPIACLGWIEGYPERAKAQAYKAAAGERG